VSPTAHRCRFFPLAALLLALAALLAAPPRVAAVMTPPAKIGSWGAEVSALVALVTNRPPINTASGLASLAATKARRVSLNG